MRAASRGVLFCLLFAARAGAEDLLTPGEEVTRSLRDALGRGDAKAAADLLDEVGGLCRYPASPEEGRALLEITGQALRSANRSVQAAALGALGQSGAEEAASLIEPFVKAPASAPGEEVSILAALRASGSLRAPLLVPALLRVGARVADPILADEALGALGEYCRAPAELRRQVAQKALDLAASLSRKGAPWYRLRAPALRALQRLMGRRMNSVEQFSAWWDVAKAVKEPFG